MLMLRPRPDSFHPPSTEHNTGSSSGFWVSSRSNNGAPLRRRQFIELGAGFALTALAAPSARARAKDRILIAGGGILGAAMAYHLSRRGAQVTLLEKTRPAAGATGKSFAWINATFSKQPRHYHLLNRLGVHAWRSLQDEIGAELPTRFGGTVEWYSNPARAEELRRMSRLQQEWGYAVRLIEGEEFSRLESTVNPGKPLVTAFSELEGSVDAGQAARVLLGRAEKAGAKIVYPCEVMGIEASPESAVLAKTSQGEFRGDILVLACGVGTPKLAALAGARVPLTPSPGLVVRTTPQASLVQRVLVTEDSHFRQQADGRLVLGDDFDPPHTEIHKLLESQPQDFPNPSFAELHGRRIRAQAARYLPAVASAPIESVSICWRPLPQDGFPVVGPASGNSPVYLAVTHSGVTLGPLLGELIAMELLDGVHVDLLEPYRPARFND